MLLYCIFTGSDYINASYIRDYRGEQSFIASQAPRVCTIDDMWCDPGQMTSHAQLRQGFSESTNGYVTQSDGLYDNIDPLYTYINPNDVSDLGEEIEVLCNCLRIRM